MTKRFYIVALVASVSFAVAGLYAAQQPENGSIINPAPVVVRDRFSDVSNQYGWGLPSASIEEVRSDLLTWANSRYRSGANIVVGDALRLPNTGFDPIPPLWVVSLLDFQVLSILKFLPTAVDLTGKPMPKTHTVYVLRDSQEDIFSVVVESYDGTFYVREIGPVLDRTVEMQNLDAGHRRLKVWPPKRQHGLQLGKPVFIPYPFPSNQVFFQYGDDPETATFEDIHTGQTIQGIRPLLGQMAGSLPVLGQ